MHDGYDEDDRELMEAGRPEPLPRDDAETEVPNW